MLQAKSLFDEGKLDEAIEQLTRDVKANPGDNGLRTFLFELLSFTGDWDRAERQLDVIGHQNGQAKLGVEVYRNNIKAERQRRRVFCENVSPNFLCEPPSYVSLLLNTVNGLHDRNNEETGAALDQVELERPAISGRIDGVEFQDFRDCDDLTGPVLEVFVNDKYTWLPYEHIKRIEIVEPRYLRDLLWVNARLETHSGAMAEVFLPGLYTGSSTHSSNDVKLGRSTEWKTLGDGIVAGAGARLFMVDENERTMFETRTIEFDVLVCKQEQRELATHEMAS
jgi:type VI secretion system protein ImpE